VSSIGRGLQIGSGAHSGSRTMSSRGYFPNLKWPVSKALPFLKCIEEVKNARSFNCT